MPHTSSLTLPQPTPLARTADQLTQLLHTPTCHPSWWVSVARTLDQTVEALTCQISVDQDDLRRSAAAAPWTKRPSVRAARLGEKATDDLMAARSVIREHAGDPAYVDTARSILRTSAETIQAYRAFVRQTAWEASCRDVGVSG